MTAVERLLTRLRDDAHAHAGEGPYLYQPIEALPEIPAVQPCRERFRLIVEQLDRPGRLLDVGCHTGWFSRAFSRLGWQVVGIDRSGDWIHMARDLNALLDENHPAYTEADVRTIDIPPADVALCLSVSMYLFPDSGGVLRRISRAAPVMFFDFGGMYASRVPATEDTIEGLILGSTDYKESRRLGLSDVDRALYMFSR